VGRLSQEELMAQLPSFLPALFEAFGNQSADVRKVLKIFCLHHELMVLLFNIFNEYLVLKKLLVYK